VSLEDGGVVGTGGTQKGRNVERKPRNVERSSNGNPERLKVNVEEEHIKAQEKRVMVQEDLEMAGHAGQGVISQYRFRPSFHIWIFDFPVSTLRSWVHALRLRPLATFAACLYRVSDISLSY